MKHLALLLALAAAGCATSASMDARYEASLLRWKGASRADLEASWGKPLLEALTADGTVLMYARRVDIDERGGAPGSPVVVVSRTNGVPSAGAVLAGAPAPATLPVTCTTRFTLKDDHVVAWSYQGPGCGAPS